MGNTSISKELSEAVARAKAMNGGKITEEQIHKLHMAIHPEDYGEETDTPETPYPKTREFLSRVDTALGNAPYVKHFGEIKQGIQQGYADFEEAHPIASIPSNAALNILSILPKAAYGAADLVGSALGVDDLDSLLKLSQVMPKTSKALKSDLSGRDFLTAAALMKGGIGKPKFLNKGTSTPLNIAKGAGNVARIGYNASVDPVGSLLKIPEHINKNIAARDAEGVTTGIKKIEEWGEQNKPAPLNEYESRLAQHLKGGEDTAVQAEAQRRLDSVRNRLSESGRQSSSTAGKIANSSPVTLSDADIMFLAQHPELGQRSDVKRMMQNIIDRPAPMSKPSLPEGGSRQAGPWNPANADTQLPPTEIKVVDHPRPLRAIGEQPPLRGQEDVAGTSGPLATTEDGVLFHPELKVEEGANAPVLETSKYSVEGKNIPEDTVHAQENIDTYQYPERPHTPENAYELRQAIDKNPWKVGKTGENVSKDPEITRISNSMRNQYQGSEANLPELSPYDVAHVNKIVDVKNARIAEANKLAPLEEQLPPIEYPKNVGEATRLLNEDTARTIDIQKKLGPVATNESSLSLADRMAKGGSDASSLGNELAITRKYPELKEFADQRARAEKYNSDTVKHLQNIEKMKTQAKSMPYNQTRSFSDPQFINDFATQMLLFGPEHTLALHAAKNAPNLIIKGLRGINEAGINSKSNWVTKPRAVSGPWGLMQNAEDNYYKENEQ